MSPVISVRSKITRSKGWGECGSGEVASRTNKGIKDAYVMCYRTKQTFIWTNNFGRQCIKEEDSGHQKKRKHIGDSGV